MKEITLGSNISRTKSGENILNRLMMTKGRNENENVVHIKF
jgi:hypothetical protein